MKWLRLRTAVTVGLLLVGTTLGFLGWYQKRGYLDLMASGARATQEARFDNLDFERAERNLFGAKDLIAYNRGVRATAAGRFAAAAGHFQEVISQSQSSILRAKAYYNLGNLLVLRGNPKEAAEMYREALRLDPSDWEAKSNLEILYAQVPGEERANASLTQAREPGEPGDETGRSGPGSEKAGI
jgi:tetratricopeptide (TPR) repeat protein